MSGVLLGSASISGSGSLTVQASQIGSTYANHAINRLSWDWTSTLYYTAHADTPVNRPTEISHETLIIHAEEFGGVQEHVQEIWNFKCNLNKAVPLVEGAHHEYTIVKSKNWYWCFEKNNTGIYVQRSKHLNTLKHRFNGENRASGVEQLLYSGRVENFTIMNIFDWMYTNRILHQTYHVIRSNCLQFAKDLFTAITGD